MDADDLEKTKDLEVEVKNPPKVWFVLSSYSGPSLNLDHLATGHLHRPGKSPGERRETFVD